MFLSLKCWARVSWKSYFSVGISLGSTWTLSIISLPKMQYLFWILYFPVCSLSLFSTAPFQVLYSTSIPSTSSCQEVCFFTTGSCKVIPLTCGWFHSELNRLNIRLKREVNQRTDYQQAPLRKNISSHLFVSSISSSNSL